jgi:diguanylate cyclase (GGDEF)-like protein
MARVLVVEDDKVFGLMLTSALQTWGHTAVHVGDGQEALREVAGAGEEFDLILCDLQMPRMPGKLFLQQAEKLIREDEIPVIVLSGDTALLQALGEVRDWIFDAVKKLIPLDRLQDLIDRALARRRDALAAREEESRVDRLERRNKFLLLQVQTMYEQSRTDPMTGLPSRRKLEEEFAGFLARGGRFGGSFVLALCDMDDFRRMNKEWGYEGGDRGITHCAELMKQALRTGDLLYRYGGDEFVLLVKAASMQEGVEATERLRRHVALAPGATAGGARLPPITFSAGLAFNAGIARPTLPVLLQEATEALRRAKENGGNGTWPPCAPEEPEAPEALPSEGDDEDDAPGAARRIAS